MKTALSFFLGSALALASAGAASAAAPSDAGVLPPAFSSPAGVAARPVDVASFVPADAAAFAGMGGMGGDGAVLRTGRSVAAPAR